MSRIRVAENFAALSLTTDLASGFPFEKGRCTCAVTTPFGSLLGLDDPHRLAVFHAALLRSIGCTAAAPVNAALFHDDLAFQLELKRLDPSDPLVFAGQMQTFGDLSAGPPSGARESVRGGPPRPRARGRPAQAAR